MFDIKPKIYLIYITMRIKSWVLFETFKEVIYGEFDEFNQSHKKQVPPFNEREHDLISNLFKSEKDVMVDDFANRIGFALGQAFVTGKGGKSLQINKLDDEWYSVAYFNPRFSFSKCWICDQFDELLGCLTMIKNKGWLSSNL